MDSYSFTNCEISSNESCENHDSNDCKNSMTLQRLNQKYMKA